MIDDLFNADMQGFLDETQDADSIKPTVEEETAIEDEITELTHVDGDAPPVEEEQIQEEVDDEEAIKQGQDGSVANDTSSLLFSFASTLVEDGALPSLDLENTKIETTQDLVDVLKNEIQSREFSDLNDLQKEALTAMRNGVPVGEFVQNKQQVQELSSITDSDLESDVEIRKSLIMKDFISKGYSTARAEKFTQRSLDLGEDIEDAKEALGSQKRLFESEMQSKIQANKDAVVAQEAAYQKQLDDLKSTVYEETKEVIPGMKFNKRIADQVYDSMTKVVDEVEGQKLNKIMKARMEDPVGFEHKLHYLFNVTKGFKDFSKLTKNAKTAAVKSFEETLSLNSINPPKRKPRQGGGDPDLGFLERELM